MVIMITSLIIKTGYALVNSPCCKGGAAGQFSHSFHCCEEREKLTLIKKYSCVFPYSLLCYHFS